jgi:hypothetical protein
MADGESICCSVHVMLRERERVCVCVCVCVCMCVCVCGTCAPLRRGKVKSTQHIHTNHHITGMHPILVDQEVLSHLQEVALVISNAILEETKHTRHTTTRNETKIESNPQRTGTKTYDTGTKEKKMSPTSSLLACLLPSRCVSCLHSLPGTYFRDRRQPINEVGVLVQQVLLGKAYCEGIVVESLCRD